MAWTLDGPPALDCLTTEHISVARREPGAFQTEHGEVPEVPWASWCLWCGTGVSNEWWPGCDDA